MRPLILMSAWLLALAAFAARQTWAELVVGAGMVALALAVYRDRRGVFLAGAVLGVMGLAWLRWDAVGVPARSSIAWWADGDRHVLTGRVKQQPEVLGATQRLVVGVTSVESAAGPIPTSGAIQVRISVARSYHKGDLVRLDGRIEPPPVLDGSTIGRTWRVGASRP